MTEFNRPILANENVVPPPVGTPFEDPAWEEFFRAVWENAVQDGITCTKLNFVTPQKVVNFTGANMVQELLTFNCGLYSNYSSGNDHIIYGYACNVRRSSGNNLVVGAQINAWASRNVPNTAGVFGIATQAIAEEGCGAGTIGMEATAGTFENSNVAAKIGFTSVFKNRLDGATVAPTGLGANSYNYLSWGYHIEAQPRSASGEYCGWSVGFQFLDGALDRFTPRVWNAATFYQRGSVVTSGGLAWKAILDHSNQAPAVPSNYWVQHTYAGTVCLGIGIDFSCLSTTQMSRMSGAIRLRDFMQFQWDVTGAIATWFDSTLGRLVLVGNQGVPWLAVDVTNGFLYRNGVFLI